MQDKVEKIKKTLKGMGSVLVAYSGGVDSTLLLYLASCYCNKVLAVIESSPTFPLKELENAKNIAETLNVPYLIIESNEFSSNFTKNNENRCYWCKMALFRKLKKIAKEHNIKYVLDGTNLDDTKDIRPGIKALSSLSIRSPLKETGFTKEEIRLLSKKLSLPTWNKPSFACLASRIPYGTKITKEKLERIEQAEEFLANLSFTQIRVRMHQGIARIEITEDEMKKALNLKDKITKRLKELGFVYVTLDLTGYKAGSMNIQNTDKTG